MAVVLVGWVAIVVVLGFLGAREADAGAETMRTVRRTADLSDLVTAESPEELRRVQAHFDRARGFLDNPIMAPARFLPVVGRHVQTAGALAVAADEGTSALEALRSGLVARTDGGVPQGEARIEFFDWLASELERLDATLDDLDLGPSEALAGRLHAARRDVADTLDEARRAVDDARMGVRALQGVFADDSRHLVIAANNAEMRIGSGMFLSVGVMESRRGVLDVGEFLPAEELHLEHGIDVPAEVERLWGWSNPGNEWRNLAFTPRFATNAEMAAEMWERSGRPDVDGVILLDVVALALLVEVTGPIDDARGRIDPSTVGDLLLHDQYLGLDDEDDKAARRDRLSSIASATLERFGGAGLDLPTLARNLRAARDGRHVMAWSRDPDVQAGFAALGATGAVGDRDLLVGLANIDGSKVDPFLRVDIEARAEELEDRQLSTLRLVTTVENRMPDGEPRYVTGSDPDVYRGVVAAYLPASARRIEVSGGAVVASGREKGSVVVGVRIAVERKSSASVTVTAVVPTADLEGLRLLPTGRTPPTRWTTPGGTVTDREAVLIDPYAT